MVAKPRNFILLSLSLLLVAPTTVLAQRNINLDASFGHTLSVVQHVVVIYQENWSFDGLYGKFPGVNGLAASAKPQVDQAGNRLTSLPQVLKETTPVVEDTRFPPANEDAPLPVKPYDLAKYVPVDQTTGDLIHSFFHEQLQIDGGKMDKFVAWSDNGGLTMSHLDATNLPEGLLAQEFVLCDNFFHSAFGGSFLNHQFLISARAPAWPTRRPECVGIDPQEQLFL